jgi:hypothetical protein
MNEREEREFWAINPVRPCRHCGALTNRHDDKGFNCCKSREYTSAKPVSVADSDNVAGQLWDDAINCDFEGFKAKVVAALQPVRVDAGGMTFEQWWNTNETWPVASKNLALLAWEHARASSEKHRNDLADKIVSLQTELGALKSRASTPEFKAPDGEDPMRYGDRSIEASVKRLTAAYCVQQPLPVPDQMALVWRFDIGRLRNDWIRLNAWQKSVAGETLPTESTGEPKS